MNPILSFLPILLIFGIIILVVTLINRKYKKKGQNFVIVLSGTTQDISAEEQPEQIVIKVRPWIRFLARAIDMWVFSFTFSIFTITLNIPEMLYTVLVTFVWIFVESILLSSWGTTLGKALLKVSIKKINGEKITFADALNRSFMVWWKGMGIGFPFVTVVTQYISYEKLSNEGITDWDREGGFIVLHKNVSALRIIISILILVGLFLLLVLGQMTL